METQRLHTEDIAINYHEECGMFRVKRRIYYNGYIEYALGEKDLAITGTAPPKEIIDSMMDLILDFIDNVMDLDSIMEMFKIPERYREDVKNHNFGCYCIWNRLNYEVGYIEYYLELDILSENVH